MDDFNATYIAETVRNLLSTVKKSSSGYYWEGSFLNTELQLHKKTDLGIFSGVAGNVLFLLAHDNKLLNHYIYGASNWLYHTSIENRLRDSSFATGYLGIVWTLLKVAEILNADIYRICAYQLFQSQGRVKRQAYYAYYNPVDHLIVLTQLWISIKEPSLKEKILQHLDKVRQEWRSEKLRKEKATMYYLADMLYIFSILKMHLPVDIDHLIPNVKEHLYQLGSGQYSKHKVITDATLLKEILLKTRYSSFQPSCLDFNNTLDDVSSFADRSIVKALFLTCFKNQGKTDRIFSISEH